MTQVRFPGMRTVVVEAVEHLADAEYQQQVWVRKEHPHEQMPYTTDDAVHALYDDTSVFEEPEHAVGNVLRNKEEAEALQPLKRALDTVFDELGTDLDDAEYATAPQWAVVVATARSALAVLRASEP
ncbi:SCO4402 family protein [Amycolatopsis cihanbeyliensis]|uniref:Uncharacterized protein n=1 Tax=Amycolatopsis cihanbeyliensis TaxID=1128664 RepID=A0A542DJ52_AMYCI|nr:hypothetical protein [Amycolatopsis cihanbeyliensis]TQJ03034.1 hypothetical protein FB471_2784 [Amycolatopsis cihanbeyliensis]